jgi:hypothetical protein
VELSQSDKFLLGPAWIIIFFKVLIFVDKDLYYNKGHFLKELKMSRPFLYAGLIILILLVGFITRVQYDKHRWQDLKFTADVKCVDSYNRYEFTGKHLLVTSDTSSPKIDWRSMYANPSDDLKTVELAGGEKIHFDLVLNKIRINKTECELVSFRRIQ